MVPLSKNRWRIEIIKRKAPSLYQQKRCRSRSLCPAQRSRRWPTAQWKTPPERQAARVFLAMKTIENLSLQHGYVPKGTQLDTPFKIFPIWPFWIALPYSNWTWCSAVAICKEHTEQLYEGLAGRWLDRETAAMLNVPMSANGMVRDLVGAVAMGCPWDKIGQNVRGFVTYDLNYALRTGIVLKAGELLKAYSVVSECLGHRTAFLALEDKQQTSSKPMKPKKSSVVALTMPELRPPQKPVAIEVKMTIFKNFVHSIKS